jgi:hypothetical protein
LFEALIPYLPEPPGNIFWVGSHFNEASRVFAKAGFHVSATTFSKDRVKVPEGALFDVALFYESAEYFFHLQQVLTDIRVFLQDRGMLILCHAFSEENPLYVQTPSYLSRKITIALFESGFRILNQTDFRMTESDCGECPVDGEIFVARKDGFSIRSYRKGDEQEIVSMFNEVFRTHRTMAHWYWKFRDNPFGSYRICLGQSDNGALVSQYAGYPVPFYSSLENPGQATRFRTLQAGDTFTHPTVRRIGLGKTGLLARTTFYFYAAFLEGVVPFAFGFNTASVKKLGERYMGYQFADPVSCWEKDLSSRSFKRPGFFSRFFSEYEVAEVHFVDDAWDEFFDRVCADYSFLVARDASYMRWRYLECPDRVHRLFALRSKGRLMGWSVFSVKDDRILWGDALFDRNKLKGVSLLLQHVATRVFSGVKSIKAWFSENPGWWRNHLLSLGFKASPESEGLTLCYKSFSSPIMDAQTVTERLHQSFYYTWGDSDLF